MLGVFLLVIGTFSVVALFTKGGQGWFFYVFLIPFYLIFPVAIIGPAGLLLLLLWLIGYPVLRILTWHTEWGRTYRRTQSGWERFATSSGSSSSGWGGFSGGFSGGGGSFGGGGASGGW